ncbi:MAG: hypothetical protein BWK76_07530 [Desulfobulbaceae bacterium A2]|nr:MAG: hypothetical protein BWK76_07530 [Desulfobulbaceae bacterium A2]
MSRNGLIPRLLGLGFAGLIAAAGLVPTCAAAVDRGQQQGEAVSTEVAAPAGGDTLGQPAAKAQEAAPEGEPLKPARKKG